VALAAAALAAANPHPEPRCSPPLHLLLHLLLHPLLHLLLHLLGAGAQVLEQWNANWRTSGSLSQAAPRGASSSKRSSGFASTALLMRQEIHRLEAAAGLLRPGGRASSCDGEQFISLRRLVSIAQRGVGRAERAEAAAQAALGQVRARRDRSRAALAEIPLRF
jgi:hypothetical protein